MRHNRRPIPREGFTLLEVMISLALGLLLLAALYVALDLQYRFAESGREVVQQSTLARSLLTRIANDMSASLGPPPRPANSQGNSSSGGSSQGSTGQTGATGSTGSGTGSSTGSSPSPPAPSMPATTSASFSLAVQGDEDRLMLFITRLPAKPRNAAAGSPASDITRITYWLSSGESFGLARQEMTLITSDDATLQPEDMADEATFVIAEEVKSLSFSYFDGSSWLSSWDGTLVPSTTSSADPNIPPPDQPAGPPLAIAITIGLLKPGGTGELKYYRHVVAIPTANGIR